MQDTLSEAVIKLDIMSERLDRHANEHSENFKIISKKIDELKDKIHTVEIQGIKETGSINVKIAGISGGISALIAILAHLFSKAFGTH